MATANLKNVTGFFLMINSKDYPSNFSPNDKFGFNSTSTESPVFSYSLNQVRDGFIELREYFCAANYDNKANNVLLLEGLKNEALASQNITNADWKGVFRIIEWAYNNQAVINIKKPVDSAYKTYPNEMLAATRINDEENIYFVSNYINGSFSYELSTKQSRLSHISFKAIVSNEQVFFDIYLDADSFMTEHVTTDSWAIYVFDELDYDGKISEEEWDKQIVSQLHLIQKKKHYNRLDKFITTWCREDASVPGGWAEPVQRTHWLFNNYPEKPESIVTREMKKNKIKEWVLKKNNNNYEYSAKEYPELFSDQQVLIVPVYDNYRTGTDGQNTICHCLSMEKMNKIIARFFNESVMASTDRLEVFHIGSDGGDQPSRIADIYPFVAGELTVDDMVTYPISSRFPEFYPRVLDGSFEPGNNVSENFHYILLKIIGYHQKRYTAAEIKNLTPAEEVEIQETTPAELGYVQFKYRGCLFRVVSQYEGIEI